MPSRRRSQGQGGNNNNNNNNGRQNNKNKAKDNSPKRKTLVSEIQKATDQNVPPPKYLLVKITHRNKNSVLSINDVPFVVHDSYKYRIVVAANTGSEVDETIKYPSDVKLKNVFTFKKNWSKYEYVSCSRDGDQMCLELSKGPSLNERSDVLDKIEKQGMVLLLERLN